MPDSATTPSPRTARLIDQFDQVLAQLDAAPAFAKVRHQEDAFALASDLMDCPDGIVALGERASRFDEVGMFHGGPWEDPSLLLAPLVEASLLGDGVYPTVEALSCLRILAIAEGRATSPTLSAEDARAFLGEVSARNLQFVVSRKTEAARLKPKLHARAHRLFEHLRPCVPLDRIFGRVVEEIEARAAQRPILTGALEDLVRQAEELRLSAGPQSLDPATVARLEQFRDSCGPATERSRLAGDLLHYRQSVRELEPDALVAEVRQFSVLLQGTGLSSPFHAVVLRRLARLAPERVGEALALSEAGVAEARGQAELVQFLLGQFLVPETHFVILGFSRLLERSLLSRLEVGGGLRKIAELPVRAEVERALLEPFPESTGLTGNAVLLAGCVAMLGLPLGIGQGNNPTCQSARGLSLWSQHAPGQLLAKVTSVARDGFYETSFEGQSLRSDTLYGGVAVKGIESDLDPVSQVLVPHLDRVYDHMMTLAALRAEDGHRWVNPALYGRWIPTSFASVFEPINGQVQRYRSFVRRFYATHHPDHDDGSELLYPNPVGIMVTDSHGRLLGRHAVSIQRIARDPSGQTEESHRVYFFNPNDEGRQDWGLGVRPTVHGHGERPGESSLPFADFTARLYAFHFDPQEQGEAFAIPADLVEGVYRAAADSWGRSFEGFA